MPKEGELVERLHRAVTEVSDLLTRTTGIRQGPPITSVDRRRIAEQAETAMAELAAAVAELDSWMTDRAGVQTTTATAPDAAPHSTDPMADTSQSSTDQMADTSQSSTDLTAPAVPTEPTGGVAVRQVALDQARADLQRAVDDARSRGATWRQIGDALGVAAQTAHKRFDPRARRRHAEKMRVRSQQLRLR